MNSGGWYFGHLKVMPSNDDQGRCTLVMEHNLLGDFVDREEFVAALPAVAGTAEEIDDEVVTRHGGRSMHED